MFRLDAKNNAEGVKGRQQKATRVDCEPGSPSLMGNEQNGGVEDLFMGHNPCPRLTAVPTQENRVRHHTMVKCGRGYFAPGLK